VLEAKVEAQSVSHDGLDDHWQARSPASRATFDLVPSTHATPPPPSGPATDNNTAAAAAAGRPSISAFAAEPLAYPGAHRALLPAELAFPCRAAAGEVGSDRSGRSTEAIPGQPSKKQRRVVRVALVGSLHVAGQNLLALEQAARLPRLCARGGQGRAARNPSEEVGFAVTYLTAATGDGPLAPLLAAAGVPLGRYQVLLSADAAEFLAAAYAEPAERASVTAASGASGNAPAVYSAAVAVRWLVAALAGGASGQNGADLAAPVREAVASLLAQLQGVHVLSFTNHETMAVHDRVGAAERKCRFGGVETHASCRRGKGERFAGWTTLLFHAAEKVGMGTRELS
jgi:hypothetical protein